MLTGVTYVDHIPDNRFSIITGRNFNMVRKLCGESTLKNVVLVANAWGGIPCDVGEACEEELSSTTLKATLEKGAQTAWHLDTAQSVHDIVRRIVADPTGACRWSERHRRRNRWKSHEPQSKQVSIGCCPTRQDRVRILHPTLLLESHPNRCHRVIDATGSGKTTVSGVRLITKTESSPGTPPVYQLHEWFEPTGWNGLRVMHS